MAKKKGKVMIATLFSQAGTGYTYHFRRQKSGNPFVLRKYDPTVRQYVIFTEKNPKIPEDFIHEFRDTTHKRKMELIKASSSVGTEPLTVVPPFLQNKLSQKSKN